MSDPPAPPPVPRQYDVVVPVKHLDRAKTRLADVGDGLRRDLVVAFLLDTLDAVTGSSRVARVGVVTDDPEVAQAVRAAFGERVRLLPDPDPTDLNLALHRGVASLRLEEGGDDGVVAVCADLPAVTSAAVTQLLGAAPRSGAGFVADMAGVGTTAYVASGRQHFAPRFGSGSRAAHVAQGATDLTGQVSPVLRCDVDTRADLVRIRDLLAPRTRELLANDENSPLLT